MNVLFRWVTAMSLGLTLMAGHIAEAQQTGALSGVVRDGQGGVLPGVTVNPNRTMRGARTRVGRPQVAPSPSFCSST